MIIDIPFELNQEVYVYENQRYSTQVWVPPDYSLGGDADGPFDRGHYNTEWHDNYKIVKKRFCFGLLDKYSINEIFTSKSECQRHIDSAF